MNMNRFHNQPRFDGATSANRAVGIQASTMPYQWRMNMARLLRYALTSIIAAVQPQSLYFVVLLFLVEGSHDEDHP